MKLFFPLTKSQLLFFLYREYESFLTEALSSEKFDNEDFSYILHDKLAYHTGWINEIIGRITETPLKVGGSREMSQQFYAMYASLSTPELFSLFQESMKKLLPIIKEFDEFNLYSKGIYQRTKNKTIAHFIYDHIIVPLKSSAYVLRKWKRRFIREEGQNL